MRGRTVAAGLWAIAFVALLLGAVVSPPTHANILSLAAVGHGFTLVALGVERRQRLEPAESRGRIFTLCVLAALLLGECAGILVAFEVRSNSLALWFALGASFAAAGVAATWRRVPTDDVFTCQIAFHATVLLPLCATINRIWIRPAAYQFLTDQPLEQLSLGFEIMIMTVMEIPLIVLVIAGALSFNVNHPTDDQRLGWTVVLVHQAVLLVMLFRWASAGL